MAEDATLERFLADAAPLRTGQGHDPVRALHLLSTVSFDDVDELFPPHDEALRVSIVAVAAPSARNTAVARYALERVAIAVEERLRAAANHHSAVDDARTGPRDDGMGLHPQSKPANVFHHARSKC